MTRDMLKAWLQVAADEAKKHEIGVSADTTVICMVLQALIEQLIDIEDAIRAAKVVMR